MRTHINIPPTTSGKTSWRSGRSSKINRTEIRDGPKTERQGYNSKKDSNVIIDRKSSLYSYRGVDDFEQKANSLIKQKVDFSNFMELYPQLKERRSKFGVVDEGLGLGLPYNQNINNVIENMKAEAGVRHICNGKVCKIHERTSLEPAIPTMKLTKKQYLSM
jgi:hypothetical protein